MADNTIPELTLEPTAAATAVPELKLDGVPTPATPAAEPPKEEAKPVELDESMLTEEEKKALIRKGTYHYEELTDEEALLFDKLSGF